MFYPSSFIFLCIKFKLNHMWELALNKWVSLDPKVKAFGVATVYPIKLILCQESWAAASHQGCL